MTSCESSELTDLTDLIDLLPLQAILERRSTSVASVENNLGPALSPTIASGGIRNIYDNHFHRFVGYPVNIYPTIQPDVGYPAKKMANSVSGATLVK